MAMSTIEPIKVQMIKVENGNAYLKLRDNVTTKDVPNDLINATTSFYIYDELTLQVTYVENIEQQIKNNFSIYWTLATEQLANKKALLDKKKQMQNLIDNDNYKLLEVNQQTQQQILDTMEVLISMMETVAP